MAAFSRSDISRFRALDRLRIISNRHLCRGLFLATKTSWHAERDTNTGRDHCKVNKDDPPFVDPVVLPLEDHLDLHPFQPKEIASVVEEYLNECQRAGFSEVRLIHGKGIGVQRNIVRSVL